jgi:type IV secretory pathway ATPase VirB11/archaellum biosynthesis ATPase
MAAASGGDRFRDERSTIGSLLEHANVAGRHTRAEPRVLDDIFPEGGDPARRRDMQATWQAFCLEHHEMVRQVLDSDRTAFEIAYRLGELVHAYFRPRGVTLTGQELRRLVAELVEPSGSGGSAPPNNAVAPSRVAAPKGGPSGLVTFEERPPRGENSWTGDDGTPSPASVPVSESTFEPSPSSLVRVNERETLDFDRLLARTLEIVRSRLAPFAGRIGREEALRAIDAAVDEAIRDERQGPPPATLRERAVLFALSEMSGLGLIDRLWADRSVRAVLINGPTSVFVERAGVLSPASEVFRGQAHLAELVGRLVERPKGGVAEFQLRDGSNGTVVFPPAAPDGPVLTIRRAEPAEATLARLLAADMLDRRAASLLHLAVQARLGILVVGPAGSGKTALLVALARDIEPATRIVTVARDRAFRWPAAAKVELVAAPPTISYAALQAAAARLQPDVLILDSLAGDGAGVTGAIGPLAVRPGQGVLAAVEASAAVAPLTEWADVIARVARGRDGLFRVALEDAAGAPVLIHEDGRWQVRSARPAFAEKLRAAGYGEGLTALLR